MLTDEAGFISTVTGPPKSVALADDHCLQAEGTGAATVVTRVGTRLNLADTLYVPSMAHNLFSVRAVCKRGGTVLFENDHVAIYKGGRVEVIGGELAAEGNANVDDEYELDLKADTDAIAARATYRQGHGDAQLWHRRLCHLGIDNLRRLVPLVTGMDIQAAAIERGPGVCHPCVKAHMERTPLASITRVTTKLELVHINLGGPMSLTRGGGKYCMGMRDDATGYSVVSVLKSKDEARAAVKGWIRNLQTQSGVKVKRVRADNADELMGAEMQAFYKDEGITPEPSTPYTPEQNGVAERFNRTLMNRTRAVLFDSGLSVDWWGEALHAVTAAINRLPTTDGRTMPWEAFWGAKSNVAGLRVWGSPCYALKPGLQQRKLEPKAALGWIVGCAGVGAYRILMADNKTILIRRDVVIIENEPPSPTTTGTTGGSGSDADTLCSVGSPSVLCESNVGSSGNGRWAGMASAAPTF